MPFGISDMFNKFPVRDRPEDSYEIIDNSVKGEDTWLYFMPRSVHKRPSLRKRAVVKNSKSSITCILPFPSVLTDPSYMKKYLDDMFEEVAHRVDDKKPESISVSGISFGNTLAFRFANMFDVSELCSVFPGSNVHVGIKEGRLTRKVYRAAMEQEGVSPRDYKENLSDYSPENNLESLPSNIQILLARFDLAVPYRFGRDLVSRIRAAGRSPVVRDKNIYGHISGLVFSKYYV